MIVGVTDIKNIEIFYDDVSNIGGTSNNGLDLITSVNEMMGIHIVPYAYTCKSCSHIKLGTNAKMCEKCKVIKRKGKVMVICENPKHKQRQG